MIKLECESCIYNQNEKEELNCDKIKCGYLKEKENQCLIFDGDDSEWWDLIKIWWMMEQKECKNS